MGAARSGSSPRVRGTGSGRQLAGQRRRFIPACAGNRTAGCRRGAYPAVHPRVCGEQGGQLGVDLGRGGSSPRVRGTVLQHATDEVKLRFIPACAGNSKPAATESEKRPVHPRVCGEQSCCRILILNGFTNVKKLTGFWGAQSGRNWTSVRPSKSTGMRRFRPNVLNAKPWSVGARQTRTASPPSR